MEIDWFFIALTLQAGIMCSIQLFMNNSSAKHSILVVIGIMLMMMAIWVVAYILRRIFELIMQPGQPPRVSRIRFTNRMSSPAA